MPRDTLFCGIDIGTSSVKVLVTNAGGRIAARRTASYGLATPAPDRAEQDADEVAIAVTSALRAAVADAASSGDVAAVAFSCALHAVLPVDANGTPLGPLLTWLDRSAAGVADAWRRDGTAAVLYARTGAPVHPMLPSCKIRKLANDEPDLVRRTARFVSLKELLTYRWTGTWTIDWGVASGTGLFDVFDRTWNDRALDAAGIDAARLCDLAPPSTTLRLRAGIASELGLRRDVAIVLGSGDGALANFGTGASGAHDMAVTLGSSGAVRSVVDAPLLDVRARTFAYVASDTRYVVGGATNAGSATIGALTALIFEDADAETRIARALAAAARIEPGAAGLTVLPFLTGERAPWWDAGLRGGVFGMTLAHTRDHVARATFEGVAFGLRAVADVLADVRGAPQRIRLSGGLFGAPFLQQLIADALAHDVDVTDRDEASAFGSALFAARTTGAIASDDAAASLVRTTVTRAPEPACAARYGEAYERYRDLARARSNDAAMRCDSGDAAADS